MKQPGANGKTIAEEFLDDVLFATSHDHYLDQHGHELGSSFFKKVYSSPALKIGMIATVGLTAVFTHAAQSADTWVDLLNPENPLWKLVGGTALNLGAATISNWAHELVKPRDYYFDTKPEFKIPLTDMTVRALLELQRKDGVKALGAISAAGVAFVAATAYLWPAAVVPVASMAITLATDKVAQWWRADQSLKGNWNVLIERPDNTVMEVVPELARG